MPYILTPADAAEHLARFPDEEDAKEIGENIDGWLAVLRGERYSCPELIETKPSPAGTRPPNAPAPEPVREYPVSAPARPAVAPPARAHSNRPSRGETAEFERTILFLYALSVLSQGQLNLPSAELAGQKIQLCDDYYAKHPGAKKWRFYDSNAKPKEKDPRNNFLLFGKRVIDAYHKTGDIISREDAVYEDWATNHYDWVRERALRSYAEARKYKQAAGRAIA